MADTASTESIPAGGRPEPGNPASPEGRANGGRRWLVLVALVFGLFMPMLDNLAVNAALPTMQRDLDASVSELQWIIDAYILTFASFMLIGGSLGDIFGRKKYFMGGLALFMLASLACGMSESAEQLIAFRSLQGVGAALLLPGSLSILTTTFRSGRRGTAIGIWAAFSGLGVAVGPQLGGYIVEQYSWQTIFLINLPVAVLGLVLTAIVVRESRDTTRPRRVDLPGMVIGTAGLFLLVYALVEGSVEGWTEDPVLGAFAASAVLLLLFVVIEARSRNPLLPLGFFRNPTFAASNVVAAAVFFALFGSTFFLALYLQEVRGFSPLETGVRLLPFTAAILLISPVAGKLSDRHGSRWLMTIGCLYAAGGMALLLRLEQASSYEAIILPAFIVLGVGMALTMAPMTAAVMGSVDPRHDGAASGATNTIRVLGGVLGIALLGALATSTFKDRLLENLTGAGIGSSDARSIVDRAAANAAAGAGGLDSLRAQIPDGTPDSVVVQVMSAAQDSLVEAIHSGFLVAVGFMLLAALVAALFVRSHLGQQHAEEFPEPETEEDEVRRGRRSDAGPVEPAIDARTEQVLREALEPSITATTAPVPATRPAPAAPEPAAPPIAPAAPVAALKPAARPGAGKKSRRSLAPVSVSDAHYHQDPSSSEPDDRWAPEAEVMGAVVASDAYHHLRSLMVDLPVKAGTGEVEKNLQQVALATLRYYQYGLSQPGGDALPVGVTNGAQSSIREDIAILAGYLDLEKRFGRVSESLATEQAAAHLITALGSRALETGAADPGNDDFVRRTVETCLRGGAPASPS